MQEYDFEIRYKKGNLQVADTLSRNVEIEANEIAAFREIRDSWYIRRMEEVIRFPNKYKNWMVSENMLYRHTKDEMLDPFYNREEAWRLVLPFELREQTLWDAHNEPCSGHLGLDKTYSRQARDFYWPGMYYDVRAYV